MLSKPEREQIIALIKREVVPAIGCTEPIAVALCVAKAREILGTEPEKVSARCRLKGSFFSPLIYCVRLFLCRIWCKIKL